MDATDLFREALREASDCSIEEIAQEAGYSRSAFDTYLNRRPPSRAAVLALAEVLEARGEELEKWAERLREAADDGAGGGDPA